MKRIIICCDGTWNTPDKQEGGIPIATNVVKVAQAVREKDAKDIKQLIYYDPGVGTSGNWLKRLYDGATGAGLMRNILEAYRFLIHNYEKGDELFFFGFSRGAFTVRSLGGLIRNSGILLPRHIYMMEHAFNLYRARKVSTHPREKEATLFRRTYSVSDITPVKFIGIWDTVGALGNPLLLKIIRGRKNQFHDTDLSSTVESAYQALAIDEKRRQFKATLWHQQPGTGEQRQKRGQEQKQTLEQLWFVGVHSNVGGGYSTTGLSDLALEWMCAKAQQGGLELKLEPPQPEPNVEEKIRESRSWIYPLSWLFPAYRPIAKPGLEPDPKKRKQTNESIHPSVLQRYQQDPSYRPKNLEDYFRRFIDKKPRGV